MFEVRIEDIGSAQTLMAAGWPTRAVSLVYPGIMSSQGPHHLVVEMDDIEIPTTDCILPEREHMERVLAFTRDLTDADRLLVHCHMGMRRSPAVAIGIMIQHGMGIEQAFERCSRLRPIMMPNQQVLRLMDEALGLGGKLTDYGLRWLAEEFEKDQPPKPVFTAPESEVDEMRRILARLL